MRWIVPLLSLTACSTVLGVDFDDVHLRDGGCLAKSCQARGFSCGVQDDACGNTIDCGTCSSGPCVSGRCECTGKTCPELKAACGTVDNGCNATLDCGKCNGDLACVTGQCTCIPKSCMAQGVECGMQPDQCGGTYFCGTCPMLKPNCKAGKCDVTSCTPNTSCVGRCGSVSDGCGAIVNCPTTCPNPNETCGGGGIANVCGCTPTTCVQLGKNCGAIPDGCGNMLACGNCAPPNTCGGNGVPNLCGCQPITQCPQNYQCGGYPDGCGNMLNCGTCKPWEQCSNHICQNNN